MDRAPARKEPGILARGYPRAGLRLVARLAVEPLDRRVNVSMLV